MLVIKSNLLSCVRTCVCARAQRPCAHDRTRVRELCSRLRAGGKRSLDSAALAIPDDFRPRRAAAVFPTSAPASRAI